MTVTEMSVATHHDHKHNVHPLQFMPEHLRVCEEVVMVAVRHDGFADCECGVDL